MTQTDGNAETRCELCGGQDHSVVATVDRDGHPLRTVACRGCGLVFSSPKPSSQELRDYYQRRYRVEYKATFEPRPKHVVRAGRVAIHRVTRLVDLLKASDRAVDLGAGGGEVVFMLRACGVDAIGVEPNEGYARFASEKLGLPVSHGFYEDAQIPPGSVDLVTCFHVMEHVESPLDALARARSWLRVGGRMVVEVPNVESTCEWPGRKFHKAHLWNFNVATMEGMGRKAGFSVERSYVSSDGGNLTVIFVNSTNERCSTHAIPGNFDRVTASLRTHTNASHMLSHHPYTRVFRKIQKSFSESSAVKAATSALELLKIESRALPQLPSRPATAATPGPAS